MLLRYKAILLAFLWLCAVSLQAQQEYGVDGKPVLKVSGTSTLHDWDMISNQVKGSAKISIEGGKVQSIQSAHFSMDAESIKSGRRQMDTNAYRAMSTNKHKQVVFRMSEARQQGDKWLISGTFNLAGSSKPVTFESDIKVSEANLTLLSTTSFKLTDFGIEPPTAVLGTIKTGDEVSLTIEMTLKPIL